MVSSKSVTVRTENLGQMLQIEIDRADPCGMSRSVTVTGENLG